MSVKSVKYFCQIFIRTRDTTIERRVINKELRSIESDLADLAPPRILDPHLRSPYQCSPCLLSRSMSDLAKIFRDDLKNLALQLARLTNYNKLIRTYTLQCAVHNHKWPFDSKGLYLPITKME